MARLKRKTVQDLDLKSLARAYTTKSVQTLGAYATNDKVDPDIRIRSIAILLDRGWGKAMQPHAHAGADGESAIEIIIRDVIEERKRK
jgi:hypothetical protein